MGALGHIPVLTEEVLEGLKIREGGIYLDGTLGEGGHTDQILSRYEGTRVVGFDRDAEALEVARKNLAQYGKRVELVHGSFADIEDLLDASGVELVNGILLDLGVSSMQLGDPDRGFSFMADGPLDMRMDREDDLTAQDVVNNYSFDELRTIFYRYGEEKQASRIAAAIVEERAKGRITTTGRLSEVVKGVVRRRKASSINPATRTFQALRIEVNKELEALKKTLLPGAKRLVEGGRMAVISFHSLEDRIVKRKFKEFKDPCTCPPGFPVCVCNKKPMGRIVTKGPITPGDNEISVNPRSRSAKLRIFERGPIWVQ